MNSGAESAIDRARRDPAYFAEALVGQPLWPHQLEAIRCRARLVTICAGRQVGKSRLLAIRSLHRAYSQERATVLIVSAGDTASKRLLDEIATLATSSPLLSGSVVDESSQLVTLSNGSTIRSVPASSKQIRGWAIDELVIDEAAWIDNEVWRAAEPAIIARPGSRVILSSSPWGGPDAFFRVLWHRGMAAPDEHLASFHWPSSVSPLVDQAYLEQVRQREAPAYFEREYEAVWTDPAGAFFAQSEIDDALGDWAMVDPDDEPAAAAAVGTVVGGVDFGMARDAHALSVIGALPELDDRGRQRFWVPYVEERFATSYEDWLDRLVALSSVFTFVSLAAETNGVGAMPASVLDRRLWEAGKAGVLVPETTSAKSKELGFGYVRMLLQQRRLELPRFPSLLKQLSALEYEMTEAGTTRINVPERFGHDDCAMSLNLAVSPLMGNELAPVDDRVYGVEDLDLGMGDDDFGYVPGFGTY